VESNETYLCNNCGGANPATNEVCLHCGTQRASSRFQQIRSTAEKVLFRLLVATLLGLLVFLAWAVIVIWNGLGILG